ncbi:MAG: helix-turn-helix domain-containing protein [Clostridiales bacterium]|nr:helix-turn-helix domain-containing protein [Clostridiales bacterium]
MGKIKYQTKNVIRPYIGRNIVKERKKRSMSQSDLLAKLNLLGCDVDRYAVSSIENNHSCNINLLADIREALNCSWDDLLDNK